MKKITLRTKITLFAQGQSRPGLGRRNVNTLKTRSKISGYILRSGAAALFFLCVVVALAWAINPTFSTSQNNTAFGVNGQGSPAAPGGNSHAYANENCMPNDYTITTGSAIFVHGITDTGNHCDDCVTPIALPFPVTFYDQTFFSVGISSNGNLQFTGASDSDFFNECPLPTARVIDLIAPLWEDLHDEDTANGQGVFTSVSGTAPNRIFNIEFRENPFLVDGPPLLDFEVCLHEDTPNFEIIYGSLNGNTGASATVGAQRDTGSHFTQFECNTGGLVDGLQLNFVYASGCQSPTPTPTPTASLAPCEDYVTTTDAGSIVPGTTDIGNHCDDCATTITFPFPVTVYGYTFTTANVSANGALYLTGVSDPTSGCLALPDPDFGRAIFPFQGALLTDNPEPGCAGYPGGMCGIFTSVNGTEPNLQFNIEWRAALASNPETPANFEVVFYENMPNFFDIIYGIIGDNGASATSGVQASGAGSATAFSCATSTLTNSLKVTYSCAEVSPTPTATATFTPTVTATATFTPTATATASYTPTPTATATATFTPTPTATATYTPTPTATPTCNPPVITVTDSNGDQVPYGGTKIVTNNGQCSTAAVQLTITATPAPCCPGPVTVTITRSDGRPITDKFEVGTTTVTVMTVDSCGDHATSTFTVVVSSDRTITSNFNGTAIPGNSYIWFNAVLKPSGLNGTNGPVTVMFFNQRITSSSFTLTVPDTTVVFDPNASCASVAFTGGQWLVTAPKSGLSGNTFFSGLAYQVPGAGLPGGINPVSWSGTFITDTAGVNVNWQWAAAVYTNFSTDYGTLGVKATDDNHHDCVTLNSDHAGTPEQYKSSVIGGARGGGGSNYTGSLSSTQGVAPCDTF